MTDLLIAVGARPNFMKAAPIVEAARLRGLSCPLVHTGQHYDDELSRVFFAELGLPEPDVYLGVGSGTHAEQTARILTSFERELLRIDPSVVVVVGDVNSTLACALAAVKQQYPVAHVEAGLRSRDRGMPEEINRRICDHLSTYLFTTSRDADENLLGEGIAREAISFVGNTMIDTLLRFEDRARAKNLPGRFGVEPKRYAVLTLHRPENVDVEDRLAGILDAIETITSRELPVVFPVHPRTRARLGARKAWPSLERDPRLIVAPPLGYLDFLGLLADAGAVLTDSGGVQEETTVLGVPCVTLRDTTERPVTVTAGTNRVVGVDPHAIVAATFEAVARGGHLDRVPELWDGRAAERIVAHLATQLQAGLPAVSDVA